jgi:hypothetical protein
VGGMVRAHRVDDALPLPRPSHPAQSDDRRLAS